METERTRRESKREEERWVIKGGRTRSKRGKKVKERKNGTE